MRNVVKDILTKWRNPLGKKLFVFPPFTGFPYSFIVTNRTGNNFDIRMTFTESPSHVEIRYTPDGSSEDVLTYNTGITFSDYFQDCQIGSTFTIGSTKPITYLEIEGHVIYEA